MLNYKWMTEHKKELCVLSIMTVALMVMLLFSAKNRASYLVKEDGEIIAITRLQEQDSISIPMEIVVDEKGTAQSYDVVLSLNPLDEKDTKKKEDSTTDTSKGESQKVDVKSRIDDLIQTLQKKDTLQILLPTQLEDGTKIQWKQKKDFRFLLSLLILPAYFLYMAAEKREREKKKQKVYEDEIKRALPTFLDQLLLLLNSGMIFHDAFHRIAANYENRKRNDAFGALLHQIKAEAEEGGAMVITVMKNHAKEVGIREYVRMVNIIIDHQHRGVNLGEKLQAESRLLWEGRKASAMQRGREMETKMTFPLALLLLVLVCIAGMPALMNM